MHNHVFSLIDELGIQISCRKKKKQKGNQNLNLMELN